MSNCLSLPFSIVAASLLWSWQISGQAQTYFVTDVSSNGWIYSESHAISGGGQVVGEYEPANVFYVSAFFYDNGTIADLGHLSGAPYAAAYGIYGTNAIVGESDTANATHAFLYTDGKMTDLGTLGLSNNSGYSSAHAINSAGQIVGESSISLSQSSTIHAVLYSGGSKTDLGALGGNYSSANAINTTGDIVGESDVVNTQSQTNVHAFKYSSHAMSDLGTLGGGYSSAKGINDSGVIVGEGETVTAGVTNLHAFIYRNGTMTDLGTLGGSTSSASAINTAGQIVGYATDTNEVSNAFLYDGSKMINLNDLIPPGSAFTNLATADAINDAGQIAGSGYRADGAYQAYLLTLAAPLRVTITTPAANSTFPAPASFMVQATTTDTAGVVTNVEFLVNNTVIANVASSPYSANASNLAAGTYMLSAIAFDSTGLAATNSITVTVTSVTDVPPTVAITNPAPNASFQALASFSIDASASDSDGSVTNVQFLVNGVVLANVTTSPYATTASSLSAGTYTLTAIAFDNAGLTATNSIGVTVTPVADVPPTVAITNPAPNSSFQAPATFSIDASASDSDGSVTNVQFLINGAVIANVTTAPYTATASSLSAGTYTLTAIAFDNAGLTATNAIDLTVTSLADVPPTVTITNPAPNASFQAPATFSIGASASDSDGSVTNVQFLVNGAVIGNVTTTPYSAIAANLTVGTYTLAAITSDNAGLMATNTISVTVTSGTASPVTITQPAFSGNSFSFSFSTQVGVAYKGQFTSILSSSNNWTTFTNLSGTGSPAPITDASASSGTRFYRVVAQ